MSSQFFKRKVKAAATKPPVEPTSEMQEITQMPEASVVQETPKTLAEIVYSQKGLDIFTSDGGKTYQVAEIAYDPETMQAAVLNIFSISRLIALSYFNQKTALETLKRKAIKKEK